MKKPYTSPTLTAVAFRTERGFAVSDSIIDQMANPLNEQIELMFIEQTNNGDYQYRETETFIEHNDWQQGNDGFWI
ncbi:MAG: hypothetical protein IKC19_08375 [Bacteroidales bacterium]|nr:hypothetical protein [Bacteroidales bacterium]